MDKGTHLILDKYDDEGTYNTNFCSTRRVSMSGGVGMGDGVKEERAGAEMDGAWAESMEVEEEVPKSPTTYDGACDDEGPYPYIYSDPKTKFNIKAAVSQSKAKNRPAGYAEPTLKAGQTLEHLMAPMLEPPPPPPRAFVPIKPQYLYDDQGYAFAMIDILVTRPPRFALLNRLLDAVRLRSTTGSAVNAQDQAASDVEGQKGETSSQEEHHQ